MQKLVYGIGGFVALLLLIGLALPAQTRVVVSADIDAPPATVFALVNDMRRINLWYPAAGSDPNARVVFSGPPRGPGSTVTWDGAIAGSGTQTITESRPYEYVETLINQGEDAETRSWFLLTPGTGDTQVQWGFEHDYGLNVIGRYFGLMVANVIRRDYEINIENLKALAESLPRTDFADIDIEALVIESTPIAYKTTTSIPDPGATSDAMGKALFEVLGFIDRHGLTESGAPMSISRGFTGTELRFDTAIPVSGISDDTPREDRGVRIGKTYGGNVIRVRHTGPYRTLAQTHRKIAAYLAAHGIETSGGSWESYVSDPTKVDEDELQTWVYYPVRSM
ncbi:MAG: SRPBCC family protein [Woeseiaceae bacterium]|nr:SRPBCC family protein [Woeseiaceae bacterium]